jgi:EKC/KEOPS complex subunit CGI121/TPRKB
MSFVFEVDGSKLDAALFCKVRNGAALVKMLASVEAAMINARLVPSLMTVKVAAWKALVDAKQNTLTTRNVHSELVFNLSPDHGITRSLKLFGVSDASDAVLVCVLNASEQQREAAFALVEGERISPENLAQVCDVALIKETYQISKAESEATSLTDAVINRISSKISKKVELN